MLGMLTRCVAAAAFSVLAGVGCAGESSTPEPGPVPDEPVRGGRITIAIDSGPDTLNPILRTTALAGSILSVINDGLVSMNTNLDFEGNLATGWSWSEDGLEVTYSLRDDVKWSDGVSFTAKDVIRSYELYTHPGVASPRASNFVDVVEVHAPSDFEVRFRFAKRSLDMIFNTAFPLLPAHAVEGLDPNRMAEWPINRAPISNGPYRVREWIANERIVLERNPHYWDEPAYLDEIVFKIVPEESVRLLQLEIGEVDLVDQVPNKDADRLRDNPEIQIVRLDGRYVGYLVYNFDDPLFQDPRVRQAISHAIDRRALIDGLMFGFADPLASPIPPLISWAHHNGLEPHRRDVTLSRQLLQSAGWIDDDGDGVVERDGVPLRFEIKTRTGDPVRENGVLILQRNLREVGIEISPRMLELSTVLDQLNDHDFQAYLGVYAARLSPDVSANFTTGGGFNYGRYSNARVDSLINEANAEMDRGQAARLWRQVQEILYEEQPMAMLYVRYPLVGIRREIQDATPNFLSVYENLHQWWRLPSSDTPSESR